MKTELKIEACDKPFCVIHASQESEEIKVLAEKISLLAINGEEAVISGWDGDFCLRINPKDIFRIYGEDKKVFLVTASDKLLLKMRLYEFEELCERFGWSNFLRISNSEFVNFANVEKLDLSLSGIIRVIMKDKSSTIVSRRYIGKIKEFVK